MIRSFVVENTAYRNTNITLCRQGNDYSATSRFRPLEQCAVSAPHGFGHARRASQHNCPVETPIDDHHYDVWTTNVAEADRSAPSPSVPRCAASDGSGLLWVCELVDRWRWPRTKPKKGVFACNIDLLYDLISSKPSTCIQI